MTLLVKSPILSVTDTLSSTKHPSSAMMLGVVDSDGKRMQPVWFPTGVKVGTKEYLDVLEMKVKPWLG